MAAMDEEQPAETGPLPASPTETRPAATPPLSASNRTTTAVVGGLLAGLGLSLAVAFLMHVVQEASPDGYAINIDSSVLLVVFIAGPVFGLGLAMALTALIPSPSPDAPEADQRPHGP
jgi:predicted lipid-binding transport protein (Tim44 family)